MNSVVQSSTNFIDAATKSVFFELVDNNLHEACMLLSKKLLPEQARTGIEEIV